MQTFIKEQYMEAIISGSPGWLYITLWGDLQLELQTINRRNFHNHGNGPYDAAFSWLQAATSTFTFKTLLRHYAKRTLS